MEQAVGCFSLAESPGQTVLWDGRPGFRMHFGGSPDRNTNPGPQLEPSHCYVQAFRALVCVSGRLIPVKDIQGNFFYLVDRLQCSGLHGDCRPADCEGQTAYATAPIAAGI